MRTQRLNMMVVLVTLSMTAGVAGCLYHGDSFAVHPSDASCEECSKRNYASQYFGSSPDDRHFSVTSNAAPPSQYSQGVLTAFSSSNRNISEPPLLVPQPSKLVPVEESNFQLLPPNPLELSAERRSPFFPGQKATLDLVPMPGLKRHLQSTRRSTPVSEPLESQQRLIPHSTPPNSLIQKIQSGFIRLFSKQKFRNSATASVAKSSRRPQSLSRYKWPKGQVSQKRLGKKRATSRVADSRISTGIGRTNNKNPVSLQVPQPIP